MITQKDLQDKVPIHRGCNAPDGCFCTGKCKEVIGYLVDGKIEYLPQKEKSDYDKELDYWKTLRDKLKQ